MALNSPATFHSRGTRVFHGKAAGTITRCRFVTRTPASDSTHLGQLIACPAGATPVGVSPADFVVGDDADYHKQGICNVETDGSTLTAATVGAIVKAGTGGIAVLDHATTRTLLGAGIQLTFDATTNIAEVELF